MEICVSFPQRDAERKQMKTDHTTRVIELHTFLVTLVRQFDFSLPDDGRRVRNVRSPGNFTPVVAGEEDKGPQLWLKVTALSSE